MIKAVMFDCFGVIRTDSLFGAYSSLGGDPEADFDFIVAATDAVSKGTLETSVPTFAQRLGVSEEAWIRANEERSIIDHEVLAYVKELRGRYKTALLTNIGKGGIKRFFDEGFLEEFFDVVVASAEIGYAKPEAQAYEITAERLGVRLDECVFIDDRQPYIDGAAAVGMQTLLFTGLPDLKVQLERLLSDPR